MRTPQVRDGLRDTSAVEREVLKNFPPHMPEAQGKVVFVANIRNAQIELQPEETVAVGGKAVIAQKMLKVRFNDGICVLDPSKPEEAEKIKLVRASEFYVVTAPDGSILKNGGLIKIRDRKDVIEEEEQARVAKHLEEHARLMENPRYAARLKVLASKAGFGTASPEEAIKTQPQA